MRKLIHCIRSYFCKHKIEVIEDKIEWAGPGPMRYLTYRCSKCGFTLKYDPWTRKFIKMKG